MIERCDVQVADADYQTTRCGHTAVYRLVNGTDRVCVFHHDSAVRLIPTSASHFEPLRREACECEQFDCNECGEREINIILGR